MHFNYLEILLDACPEPFDPLEVRQTIKDACMGEQTPPLLVVLIQEVHH